MPGIENKDIRGIQEKEGGDNEVMRMENGNMPAHYKKNICFVARVLDQIAEECTPSSISYFYSRKQELE